MKKQVFKYFYSGSFYFVCLGNGRSCHSSRTGRQPHLWRRNIHPNHICPKLLSDLRAALVTAGRILYPLLVHTAIQMVRAEAASGIGFNTSLKAKAAHNSGADYGAIATARAIQGYTYTGTGLDIPDP